MNHAAMLKYHDKLKRVYLNSKIQDCYRESIVENFMKIERFQIEKGSPMFVNGKIEIIGTVDNLYPEHLQYKESEVSNYVYYSEFWGADSSIKWYIKKELLRKFYLLTFENILSQHKFGIAFNAIHAVPINHIPFTMEYSGSGKMYKDFFGSI